MKKNKLLKFSALAAAALMLMSCLTTGGSSTDPAIERGISAWNFRKPSAATAYWSEIADSKKQQQYLNYVKLYEDGLAALESTDSIKSTNETKLLAATNRALNKFSALDKELKLPANVREKGANLTATRIDKLIASDKSAEAKKMYNTAVKVYGTNSALSQVGKEVDTAVVVSAKKDALKSKADAANEEEDLDKRIETFNSLVAAYPAEESAVNSAIRSSGLASTEGLSAAQRNFKKLGQDLSIQRQAAIREKAYYYKELMGEEFARQPENPGSGKNGSYTLQETLDHYNSVKANIDVIYDELLAFRTKYPSEIDQNVINDINSQRNELKSKIAEVNKEIETAKEIASRGKTVMPLMIGLFNPEAGTSGANQKSRPAKFSATKAKSDEYWWGMVSIPKGQMNDLVITVNDNRTVRVFNENTKSGKLIEKNGLKDLVNRQNKVGNSWPVMNAGSQLKGSNYFFEIQKGKTENYSGEVVVYKSFIVRMR